MFDYDSNFSESSSQDHGNRRAESQNTGDRRTNSLPRGGKTSLNNANPKRYINQLIGVRVGLIIYSGDIGGHKGIVFLGSVL